MRIAEPDFVPTDTDVLHVKLRTTGVKEIFFEVNHHKFSIIDVGGQVTDSSLLVN